jgi:hypothetical protein
MTANDFDKYRNQAIQMNARSTNKEQQTKKENQKTKPINNTPLGLNIPVLDFLSTDKDAALIIGLLLILMSEKSDKMLLFALVYILL